MASVRKRIWSSTDGKRCEAWVVEYTDEVGKRHRHTPRPNTKAAAEKIAAKLKKGAPLTTSFLPYRIRDLCAAYLKVEERKYADEVITRERLLRAWFIVDKLINPTLGDAKAASVTPMAVQNWVDHLRQQKSRQISAGVAQEALRTLGRVLTEGVRLEVIQRNVVNDAPPYMTKPKANKIAVPSKADLKLILANCEDDFGLFVRVAIFTGLRLGEIRALKWRNFDAASCKIVVEANAGVRGDIRKTKTKAGERTVPVPPDLSARLRRYCAEQDTGDNTFIFPQRKRCAARRAVYVPLGPCKIHNMWKSLLSRSGVGDIRFHSLRHAAASLYIESGLTPQRVKYLLGHSSIAVTFDTYGYLFPEDDAAAKAAQTVEQNFISEDV